MKANISCSPTKRSYYGTKLWLYLGVVLGIGAASLRADIVVVESRTGGQNFSQYAEVAGSWANSSAKSRASGCTGGIGSRYTGSSGGPAAFSVTPILEFPGGTYLIEATLQASGSPDLLMSVVTTGGELSTNLTDAFRGTGYNTWKRVGVLSLYPGSQIPTVTFTYSSGTVCSSANESCGRIYADAVRFVSMQDPCVFGLPELATVNGPLAAGQDFVNVPAVSSNATAVFVYADNVQVGSVTNGVTGGLNVVPLTTPLVKGQMITASQWDATMVESCRSTNGGAIVGGGANPRIRVAISIRQNTALTGPIGLDGGTATAPLKFLGATNVINGGYGNAPSDGKVISPALCWQTLTFERGPDPLDPTDRSYAWAGSDGTNIIKGDFGVLEAIAFAIDDLSDTGPFRIYIDNIKNGDTVIQDFETATNGQQAVLFSAPGLSSTTTPFLLAPVPGTISPNITRVTTQNADSGQHSALISWQFKDLAPANWLRLVTQGAITPNPQVDLRLPISFRLLLLPVGETNGGNGQITAVGPGDQVVPAGEPVTLSTVVTGSGPFTYLWRRDGVELTGQTQNTLTFTPELGTGPWVYAVEVTSPCASITNYAGIAVASRPTLSAPVWNASTGELTFLCTTQIGLLYIIEYKDSVEADWAPLQTVPGDGTALTICDTTTPRPQMRLYRVRIQ